MKRNCDGRDYTWTNGILEVGIIQPQSKFLEEYQLGVTAVIGRREGNSIPLCLINMQKEEVILQKNVQIALVSLASIVPEEKPRRHCNQAAIINPANMFGKDMEELT